VFVLAAVPVSALASLCQPVKCSMPCCQVQQNGGSGLQSHGLVHGAVSQELGTCCGKTTPSHELAVKTETKCGCELRGSSEPLPQDAVISISRSQAEPELNAVLPYSAVIALIRFESDVQPSLVGFDSGQLLYRPHCLWIGRAPPVLIA